MTDVVRPGGVSRRTFIKGVVAAGAVATSAGYLLRTTLIGQGGVARGCRRAPHHPQRQRPRPPGGRHAAGNAGHDAALQARPHRHEDRLRPRGVRRVHGPAGRRAALFVLGAHAHGAQETHHHDRGPRRRGRHAPPGAAGRGRGTGVPVRVLHARLRDGGRGLPQDHTPTRRAKSWRTACPATCAAARTTTRFSPRSRAAPN